MNLLLHNSYTLRVFFSTYLTIKYDESRVQAHHTQHYALNRVKPDYTAGVSLLNKYLK
jgi:hypothetical protein